VSTDRNPILPFRRACHPPFPREFASANSRLPLRRRTRFRLLKRSLEFTTHLYMTCHPGSLVRPNSFGPREGAWVGAGYIQAAALGRREHHRTDVHGPMEPRRKLRLRRRFLPLKHSFMFRSHGTLGETCANLPESDARLAVGPPLPVLTHGRSGKPEGRALIIPPGRRHFFMPWRDDGVWVGAGNI
jgi:hypothetical protein